MELPKYNQDTQCYEYTTVTLGTGANITGGIWCGDLDVIQQIPADRIYHIPFAEDSNTILQKITERKPNWCGSCVYAGSTFNEVLSNVVSGNCMMLTGIYKDRFDVCDYITQKHADYIDGITFILFADDVKVTCQRRHPEKVVEDDKEKNMELCFDKKDVFTIANVEEAKAHLNTKGYFGDKYTDLENDIRENYLQTLTEIDTDDHADIDQIYGTGSYYYGMFLPADKVKRSKKEARVIKKLADLRELLGVDELVGTVVHLKGIDSDHKVANLIESIITSTTESTIDNSCFFVIGSHTYKIDADGTPDPALEKLMKYTLIRNKDGDYVPWTLAEVQ